MLNNKSLYVIWLEDYHLPRYAAVPKPYMGTESEIKGLMQILAQMPGADERYADLIGKTMSKSWGTNVITHTVAGKHLQLLNEVEEVCRHTFCVEEPAWEYTTYTGNSFPMAAKNVAVDQVLVRWPDGRFCRCVKVCFEELMIRNPGVGWCLLKDVGKGFPGMYMVGENKNIPQLYTLQRVYGANQREQAMKEMCDCESVDLSVACQDIIGEM